MGYNTHYDDSPSCILFYTINQEIATNLLIFVYSVTEGFVKLSESRRALVGCFLVYVGKSATAACLGGFLWVVVLYAIPGRAPPPRRPDVTVSQRQKRNSLERVLFLLFPKSRTCGRFSPKIREQGSLSKESDLLIVQSIINTHTLLKVLTWPLRAQALLSEGVLIRVHLINLIVGRFCLTSDISLGRFCLTLEVGQELPDQQVRQILPKLPDRVHINPGSIS